MDLREQLAALFLGNAPHEDVSHPEIFKFQDVIKIKNKTTIFL